MKVINKTINITSNKYRIKPSLSREFTNMAQNAVSFRDILYKCCFAASHKEEGWAF